MIRTGAPQPKALKSYVERIELELTKIDSIKDVIAGIYDEAKAGKVVPKILRKLVARRRTKDQARLQKEDDLLEAYLAALDGPTARAVELAAQGATAREIERETGIDQATVARSVSLKKKRETPPHDPETGEITPGEGAADAAKPVTAQAAAPREGSRVASCVEGDAPNITSLEPAVSLAGEAVAPAPINESCGASDGGGVADSAPPVPRADATAPPRDPDDFSDKLRAVALSLGHGAPGGTPLGDIQKQAAVAVAAGEDPWAIPAFLDRRRVPA